MQLPDRAASSMRNGGAGLPCTGVYEIGQTGDAGEGAVRLFGAEDRDAKFFFDADGKFEQVQGVEAEAVSHSVRLEHVGPEHAGDEPL